MMRYARLTAAVMLAALLSMPALAVTCNSVGSGNWTEDGTWDCNGTATAPTANDDVIINAGHTVRLDGDPGAANSLLIDGVVTWGNSSRNNNNLTTNIGAGGIIISSTGDITGTATGSILSTTGNLAIHAPLTNNNVTIRMAGAATAISGTGSLPNLAVNAAVTNSGRLTVRTTLSGTGTLSNAGVLNIGGASPITGLAANASGNTVNYIGANQTIKSPTGAAYHHLALSGSGTKTLPVGALTVGGEFFTSGTATTTAEGVLTLNGNFTVGTGTTFNADTFSHTLQGNFTNRGTFNADTSTFTFTGAGTSIISGNTTFNHLATSGTKTVTAAADLIINGDVTLGANTTFAAGNFSHIFRRNFSNSGLFSGQTSTVTFNGAAAQTLTGDTAFHTLVLNNAAGLTLANSVSSNATVGNILTFTNGKITTGSNKVIFGASGAPSGATAARYVVGSVMKFYSGTGTMVFPIGDATRYTPVEITGTSGFGAGSGLTIGTTGVEHLSVGTSGIDAAKSVNRYWTLTPSNLAGSTYDATFNFINGSPVDYDSGSTPGSFIVKRFDSTDSSWSSTVSGSATCTPAGTTHRCNKIVGASAFGEFAIGEPGSVTLTCFSDNFNRTSGLGPDWVVGSEGANAFTPAIVSNRLRLTNTSTSVATYATLQRFFPAAANKVVVMFQHYAYAGSGADGLAIVLSDASQSPAAGAFGGSLGYAQKTTAQGGDVNHEGFVGGWIGVGLDEYGSYSAAAEGRSGGPGQTTDSVAIRGSGSGYTGYTYLKGSGSLSPGIDVNSNAAGPGHIYRVIIDNTNGTNAWTSVERDTGDGSGFAFLVPAFDAKAQPNQADVPTNLQLSITASTGGLTNRHEIDGLLVCTNVLQTPVLHHIELVHRGSVCGAERVTVKACADAGCTSLYGGSVTVNLTSTPVTEGNGTSTWSPASPITFTGGETQATLTHSVPNATVTLGASVTSPAGIDPATTTCNNGVSTSTCAANTLTFVAACFDAVEPAAAPSTPIYTKLAGVPFTIDVLALGASSAVNTGFTGEALIDLVDPNSASGGNCTNTSPGLNEATSYTFAAGDAGRKSFSFTYNKAARNVKVRVISGSPSQPVCSKDNFAIRPQYFNLSTATDLVPSKDSLEAGANFNLTAAPAPEMIAGYTGRPLIDLPKVVDHNSVAITSTALTGNFPAAAGGNAAGTFQYNDVGTITLQAEAVTDPNFTAVDQQIGVIGNVNHGTTADCIAGSSSNTLVSGKYGCNIGSPAALGPLGRFKPDHYEVFASLAAACNGFTYMGQSALGIALNVQAMSSNRLPLPRYTTGGNFSGLCSTPSSPQSTCLAGLDIAGDNAGAMLAPINNWLTPDLPSFVWTNGAYSVNGSSYRFDRQSNPEGPYDDFRLKVAVSDIDGVKIKFLNGVAIPINSAVLSTATKLRYGRLFIDNNFGSQLLDLPVKLTAQHWDSAQSRFVTNTVDNNCTTSSGNLTLIYLPNSSLNANNMPVSHITKTGPLLNGVDTITLAKPSPAPATRGSVDLSSTVSSAGLVYLPGIGRQTFGVTNAGPIIYMRERY